MGGYRPCFYSQACNGLLSLERVLRLTHGSSNNRGVSLPGPGDQLISWKSLDSGPDGTAELQGRVHSKFKLIQCCKSYSEIHTLGGRLHDLGPFRLAIQTHPWQPEGKGPPLRPR